MRPRKRSQEKRPIEVFDRGQIAQILRIPPALVRNWSTGKPFEIEPAVRSPKRRGSTNLYSVSEVYLMGIASAMVNGGAESAFVDKLLRSLSPEWFEKEKRGFVICSRHGPAKLEIKHVGPGTTAGDIGSWVRSHGGNAPRWILDLHDVLGEIDKRIENLRMEGKL